MVHYPFDRHSGCVQFFSLKTKLLRKLRVSHVYVFSLIKYLEAELLAQRLPDA